MPSAYTLGEEMSRQKGFSLATTMAQQLIRVGFDARARILFALWVVLGAAWALLSLHGRPVFLDSPPSTAEPENNSDEHSEFYC